MGCICSKGRGTADEYIEAYVEAQGEKSSIKFSKQLVASSRREEVVVSDAHASFRTDGARTRLISKSPENGVVTPTAILSSEGEKTVSVVVDLPRNEGVHQRRATVDLGTDEAKPKMRITVVPNGLEGEHVAAGWPSWLTAVAGEATKGWLPRRADSFERLDKIGQGTYSNVYRARDLETGKVVALKKVRFVNMDPESVRFMAREIHILRRLDHPNIVKLEGLVTSQTSCSLYLVFEYMEHDLAGLAATPGLKFSEPQIKCYMQQLLCGLEHCHNHGVLHRDIKGSNLLIDNNGILKIADFGLATFFNTDKRQPLTSRVVTLWYRPPELLLGATEYGVAVDLWSTGCILAELLAGKPIMPGRTEVEQLHKIFKLCGSPSEDYWRKSKLPHATVFKPQHPYRRCISQTFQDFPPSAMALLDILLAIEPEGRGTAASALTSEFFTTKPFACEPSSLPKYPPSKEFDAKLRDEEARRQKAAASKGCGSECGRRSSRDLRTMPAQDVNVQKQPAQSNPKSSSEKFNPHEDCKSGFPVDPARGTTRNGFSHSGQLLHSGAYGSWGKKLEDEFQTLPGRSISRGRANGSKLMTQRSYMPHAVDADLSNFVGLAAVRGIVKSDNHQEKIKHSSWPEQSSRHNQLDVAQSSDKPEWTHHLSDRPSSSQREEEKVLIKESSTGYGTKQNRIHYSGPLIPAHGNIEEMLKEHERQIQQAVRKARIDKAKTRKSYGEKGQYEALLQGRNGS